MYGQAFRPTAMWVKFWKASNDARVVGVAASEAVGAELALSRSSQVAIVEEYERTTTCVSMVSIPVGILKDPSDS